MKSVAESVEKATGWLASIQDKKTGGWGEYQGAAPNVLNSAEAILALLDSNEYKAGDNVIQRGVHYIEGAQLTGNRAPHPADEGAWGRLIPAQEGPVRHLPDTVRSAFALLALNYAGKASSDPTVGRGVDWLVRTINNDGGWGYAAGCASQLFTTCVVLRAMLRLHGAGDDAVKAKLDTSIKRGLAHLHDGYRNQGGSFGRAADLIVPHTLYAIRTLLLARGEGFPIERRDIEDAVNWIDQQGPGVTRWVNESIEISDKESGPYTYTHVTPALYLDTFGDGLSAKNAVARESMIVMHDNMDPVSCGMSGKRPVSWATAKGLCGLVAARSVFTEFPEREIPTGQAQGRQFLLVFLVLICGSATAVALAGRISSEYVGLMFLVVLAGLLVYGFISEQSFFNAVSSRLQLKKTTAGE